MKASPPAEASKPVLVPGDPERLSRAERGRDGIPLDAGTWSELLNAAETMGLPRTQAESMAAPVSE